VPFWQQPFFQVALPIVVTIVMTTWYQAAWITDVRDDLGKRIDDLGADLNSRFGAVEKPLENVQEKVEALQERSRK
jgi:hypothetical protein